MCLRGHGLRTPLGQRSKTLKVTLRGHRQEKEKNRDTHRPAEADAVQKSFAERVKPRLPHYTAER